ncbi:MAG: hypothetical protein HQL64_14620 [Magnetococcales bacterium]|nr:hypothetical protein [Magnetococcales bacterium]
MSDQGHTQASTTQRYAHLSADPLKVAADRIPSQIAAVLNGTPKAEVIPLFQFQIKHAIISASSINDLEMRRWQGNRADWEC